MGISSTEPVRQRPLLSPTSWRIDSSLGLMWGEQRCPGSPPPHLSGHTASLLPAPVLTIALCPEGKGPVVCDHFKLLVPDGSHAGDAGHRDKALRVGVLRKRRKPYGGGWGTQRPSPSLAPSTSAEAKANCSSVSHRWSGTAPTLTLTTAHSWPTGQKARLTESDWSSGGDSSGEGLHLRVVSRIGLGPGWSRGPVRANTGLTLLLSKYRR